MMSCGKEGGKLWPIERVAVIFTNDWRWTKKVYNETCKAVFVDGGGVVFGTVVGRA